ncbi:MAG: ABC transporter permease [Planctomycetota bacterium]
MNGRIWRTVKLGLKSLALHKLRSGLTVLGIVFGVCSVISMLSIGEGASWEAQEQIKALGSTSIIVDSVQPPENQSATAERSRVVEYGLKYADAERIQETIPGVKVVIPVRQIEKDMRYADRRSVGVVKGTLPYYFQHGRFQLQEGRFLTDIDVEVHANVGVLGAAAARELFPFEDPIGKILQVGTDPFRVVGVLREKAAAAAKDTGTEIIEETGRDFYIPLPTAQDWFGEVIVKISSGSRDMERVQLHGLQIQIEDDHKDLEAAVDRTATAVRTMLERHHPNPDYRITVPLELLRSARETKRIFNIVLGSIAGISLLVGGIGIMNIMLASVTERTREIGVRRALGAKRKHIISQFLIETVVLSIGGGLLGMLLGVIIPQLVTAFAGMKTIITPFSLILAFGISGLVGILFGIYPAWRAANMDPIDALRHE